MKSLLGYIRPYRTLAILAPLFMMLEVASELAMPKIMTVLLDQGVAQGDAGFIGKIGGLMLLISVIGIIGGIGSLITSSIVSQRTGTDLRKAAFGKIQEFSFHNIDTFQTPSLITRLTNDITQIQITVLMSLRMLVRAPLLCVGSIIMAFSINVKIATLFLLVVALLALAISLILRAAMPKFKIVQDKLDKVNTVMRECLAGIRVVKAFVRDEYETEKFTDSNMEYKNISVNAFKIMLLIMPTMMILLNGSIVTILWIGGY